MMRTRRSHSSPSNFCPPLIRGRQASNCTGRLGRLAAFGFALATVLPGQGALAAEPDAAPETAPETADNVGPTGVARRVDPKQIRPGVWRGKFWFSLAALIGGPLGGERPAKPSVVAVGGSVQIGFRPYRWLGVFTGAVLHPHDTASVRVVDANGAAFEAQIARSVIHLDVASLRWFAPVKGYRLQPRVDLGGEVFVLPHSSTSSLQAGGGMRAAVGADLWIGRVLSLAVDLTYRVKRIDDQSGHSLAGMLGVTLHR